MQGLLPIPYTLHILAAAHSPAPKVVTGTATFPLPPNIEPEAEHRAGPLSPLPADITNGRLNILSAYLFSPDDLSSSDPTGRTCDVLAANHPISH